MLMKAARKKIGLTLAGMMTLSSLMSLGLGASPARADDDWYSSVKNNCERVNGGYFCQKSDRYESSRRDRSNRRFGLNGRNNRSRNGRFRFRSGRLYEGSVIPTRTYRNDRIEIRRGDSRNLTLVVDRDIYSDDTNELLIPEGSRIEGRLRPKDGGIRYDADTLILSNGERYNLKARSEIISSGRRRSANRGLTSSAAQVILGSVLGRDLNVGDVISGGNILSRTGSRSRDRIIKINPRKDLDLRLTGDLKIN